MFNTMMYQPPVLIQLSESQVQQHCTLKERVDNSVNYVKRENGGNAVQYIQSACGHYNYNGRSSGKKSNSYNRNVRDDGATVHYVQSDCGYYNYNGRSSGKEQNNGYNRNLRVLSGFDHNLSQSQETLSSPSLSLSHDSFTDSSSEDLNDPTNKGVKRLHEVNGTLAQPASLHTINMPTMPTFDQPRSLSPQQIYQKRRHHTNKFTNLQYVRRGKNLTNNTPNYQVVPDRFLARSQLMEVKDVPEKLKTGSRWDQLSTDIWRKFMANQQTSESYIKKMNLFKYLYTNIKVVLRYSVFVVGSTLNGFGTNNSDLDLCLVIRNHQMLDMRADAIQHLLNTHELFTRLDYIGTEFQKLELIEAKVPLLKFHHSWGIDVDVNCNNPVGIRNTHLLHCYAKADWRVQPLVLVVKLWAQAHQINDAKNMTISSYSLALMVIHFLQCGTNPAVLPCLQLDFPEKFREDQEIHNINMLETLNLQPTANTQSLGELLLQFYQYYNYFKFNEHAISVRLGTTLPIEHCRRFPSPKNEPRAWSFLCIEEPFDHTNTARAVYDQDKFEHIRKVFQLSYQCLKDTRSLNSIFQLKVTT